MAVRITLTLNPLPEILHPTDLIGMAFAAVWDQMLGECTPGKIVETCKGSEFRLVV